MIDWTTGVPERFYLPSISDLRMLSIGELAELLERFGIAGGWPAMKASAAGYVQRMTSIPPGSEAFLSEIDALTDAASKRGALSLARGAYRDLQLYEAADGDPGSEFIWISEHDGSTCKRCLEREGDIDSLAGHARKGLPGPSVCEGGGYCRCQLVRIM
jgi:hypothetical protein